jgi:excinuclease ABC subunit A
VLEEIIGQILSRLRFLVEVGLDYLHLGRKATHLSNGESQRLRLARQLGGELTSVLYVLDEPTIGLHPHDTGCLHTALQKLKDLGNTLLLVEHDPQTIAIADYILDFGPKAGNQGGHITAQGTYPEILSHPHSLTGAYLSGAKSIPPPEKRREATGHLPIEHITAHNVEDLSFSLPLGVMTCLTGLSGSGKSTILHQGIASTVSNLLPSGTPFKKLVVIDQNPIGRSARSDVGTYADVFPLLRDFFASLAGAQTRGLRKSHFSYNHPKGCCFHCLGLGYRKIAMLFMPSVQVACEVCQGMRLNPLSLTVKFGDIHFGHLFSMTVEEARSLFTFLPEVCRRLDLLLSVGLGYLQLGQPTPSLSGGEGQRMKLAREFSLHKQRETLYLLDEPTTGLHAEDIQKLLPILHKLVDNGNTLVIIEHNLHVIQHADYLIDIGPGAGREGGKIVSMGTPEIVSQHPHSITGRYLRSPALAS